MKSVKTKIILSFLVVTIIYSIILTGTILGSRSINNSYHDLLDQQVVAQNNLQVLIQHSQQQALAVRGHLISNSQEHEQQFKQSTTAIYTLIEQTTSLLNTSEKVDKLTEIQTLNTTFEQKYDRFLQLINSGQSQQELIAFWEGELLPIGVDMRNQATVFTTDVLEEMNTQVNANFEQAHSITKTIITVSTIVLIAILIFSAFVASIIARPIRIVTEATQKLAQGDLSLEPITVKTRDEVNILATAFNEILVKWRTIVQNITTSSNKVATSAEELIASAEETAKTTEHITHSIQDVAAGAKSTESHIEENKRALEEMTIGVTRVAEATSSVAQISEQTRTISNSGRHSIEQVMTQMNQINASTNDTAAVIGSLNARSSEIISIVKVITDISEQTNLLSLNAAIEAARAGEQGKGFAVVADEVRKLAEQSHRSADSITHLINAIQNDTQMAVASMQKGAEEVAYGLEVVKVADQGFEAINSSVETLAIQIEDITAISEEMSASAEELLASMEEILSISETAASNSETVAAASEQQLAVMQEVNASVENLASLAETLREEIKHFKLN